jgi:two-component system, NarL family, nitrate/nitrite response regulator NarL
MISPDCDQAFSLRRDRVPAIVDGSGHEQRGDEMHNHCQAPLLVHRSMIVSELRFLRDSLVEILRRISDLDVCGEAATPASALVCAAATRPHIVLLDVAFPVATEMVGSLCALLPAVNVIAVGVRETEEDVLAWADAGVVGYVPNTASVDDLISLVGQISRGEQSCPSHIAGSLLRRVAAAARGLAGAEPSPASSALTPREMEIFRLVGAGLSNKDIARRLCISVGTTKTHVHSVLGKLSLKRRVEVISHMDKSLR